MGYTKPPPLLTAGGSAAVLVVSNGSDDCSVDDVITITGGRDSELVGSCGDKDEPEFSPTGTVDDKGDEGRGNPEAEMA